MGEVKPMPGVGHTPNTLLAEAMQHDLRGVIVLGLYEDGSTYLTASLMSGPEWSWLQQVLSTRTTRVVEAELQMESEEGEVEEEEET